MEVCEEEREWRTGGGRKEVGLARAMERVERTGSHPSEREREKQREGRRREMQRDGKSGRERQPEGEKQRGE